MRAPLSRLTSHAFFAGSLAFAGAVIALSPVQAVAAGSGYSATLAAALPAPKAEIVNGVLWKCAGVACAAPDQGSRPVLVCQKVARKFGEVARFAGPDGELAAEDLAKCNNK